MQQNFVSRSEALEIAMKLESTPMGESNLGMSQILSQLTSLSLEVEDMKKDKGKDKREDIWCVRCRSEGHEKEHCPLLNEYLAFGALSPLKKVTLPWCEVCRNRHRPGECYYMKKYVQTPKNLYCTFCKSIGHDDRDCRAYDLMHERSRDIYKIQGEVQQEGNTTQYNSPGRGNFNPRGGFRGRGRGGGMGRGRGQIIYYNCAQLGHLTRDCQNPCTTCSYCSSFEHVIEDCPVLLAKLQERRGPQQNPQVQLIYVEPRKEDPRVVVITRGGTVTGEDRLTQGNITEDSGIRKATEKTQMFDVKKERQMFEEARKNFRGDQGSSSKTRPEVREYGMPLAFDQFASPKE
jgi:hypothetical protein